MSIIYKSLNKNEHWALGSSAEGVKKGAEGEPTWLATTGKAEIPGVSYWVVPWGATKAKAGVKAEPDDGRWLGVAFGATQVICYHPW